MKEGLIKIMESFSAAGLSFIMKGMIKIFPRSYRQVLIPFCYQEQLKVIQTILGKIPEDTVRMWLSELIQSDMNVINLSQKSEINRLMSAVNDLLALVEKQSSMLNKILLNGDQNIIDVLRNNFSNEWLWLIAFYLFQNQDQKLKEQVIKYQLLKSIQHLNEFSLEEVGRLPNDTEELYQGEIENFSPTAKGIFFAEQGKIAQYLSEIKSQFLPQE